MDQNSGSILPSTGANWAMRADNDFIGPTREQASGAPNILVLSCQLTFIDLHPRCTKLWTSPRHHQLPWNYDRSKNSLNRRIHQRALINLKISALTFMYPIPGNLLIESATAMWNKSREKKKRKEGGKGGKTHTEKLRNIPRPPQLDKYWSAIDNCYIWFI